MDLDSFLISIIFDNAKTQESAKKIENVVDGLKNKIIGAFSAIASIDFLKNAVERSVELATNLDNLSYSTNISKEKLSAWGEAVKRNGGTVEGFYASVSSLSEKIRDMQTSFGSAGQTVFARLGISIKDSSGHIRDAVDVLGELSDKFQTLPKVWQQNLGKQLGLDQGTIRLLASGNEEAQKLVANMAKLGQISQLDTEKNIKFRNTLYDISLVFESIKLKIADALIPVLQRFSEMLLKGLSFLQEHATAVRAVIVVLSLLLSGSLLSAIVSVTRAFLALSASLILNPITLITAAFLALGLVIQDLNVYLDNGQSAFKSLYDWFAESGLAKVLKYDLDLLDQLNKKIREFFGVGYTEDPILKKSEEYRKELNKLKDLESKQTGADSTFTTKDVKENITKTALKVGVDPSIANTIANIESGLNPGAKNSFSSASGVFQLTDATAFDNGVTDLSKKNDINQNINAGVNNLKRITDGLANYFHRKPTGPETYLGEWLGLAGSKNVFSANQNTMLSSILSPSALKANPQFQNMTAGQLVNNANKTYEQKSVTIGEVKINAPNSDARQISQQIWNEMQKHYTNLVTNIDNGIRS